MLRDNSLHHDDGEHFRFRLLGLARSSSVPRYTLESPREPVWLDKIYLRHSLRYHLIRIPIACAPLSYNYMCQHVIWSSPRTTWTEQMNPESVWISVLYCSCSSCFVVVGMVAVDGCVVVVVVVVVIVGSGGLVVDIAHLLMPGAVVADAIQRLNITHLCALNPYVVFQGYGFTHQRWYNTLSNCHLRRWFQNRINTTWI